MPLCASSLEASHWKCSWHPASKVVMDARGASRSLFVCFHHETFLSLRGHPIPGSGMTSRMVDADLEP
jgi:hypothetical protein